jgi:hypothetical protein
MKPEAKACCATEPYELWQWLILAALSTCLVACDQQQTGKDVSQIRTAQRLSVLGEGYTRPPGHVDAATLPAVGWQPVTLPDVAKRDLVSKDGGTHTLTDWYRLDLSLPAGSEEERYLYLPRWKTIGQIAIYGDGALLYSSEGSMTHNGYNHPLMVRLNPTMGQGVPAVVLLRIDRLKSSGRALSTVWVGAEGALVWRYQARQILQVQLPYIGGAAFLPRRPLPSYACCTITSGVATCP